MENCWVYPQADLPEKYACQVLTFLRTHWPEGFMGENRLRNWITRPEFHPLSVLLEEEDLVISHAQVVWKYLEHAGQRYKTYGITGVFTFPSFRGKGYGIQTIRTATALIQQSDADIGMFHCDPGLAGFYARCGWLPMVGAETWVGSRADPQRVTELMMMQFFSEKGIHGRETFQNEPVFFDEDTTW